MFDRIIIWEVVVELTHLERIFVWGVNNFPSHHSAGALGEVCHLVRGDGEDVEKQEQHCSDDGHYSVCSLYTDWLISAVNDFSVTAR